MTTLKEIIYNILLNKPETRDSDKRLIWEVWREKGLIDFDGWITEESFMKAPSCESIRRCRQGLQRIDKLLGKNLIKPSDKISKQREEESKLKGYHFIEGQESLYE